MKKYLYLIALLSFNVYAESNDDQLRDNAIDYIESGLSINLNNKYESFEINGDEIIFKDVFFDIPSMFSFIEDISFTISDFSYKETESNEVIKISNAIININKGDDVDFLNDSYSFSLKEMTSKESYHDVFYDIEIENLISYKIDLKTETLNNFEGEVRNIKSLNIDFSLSVGLGDLLSIGELSPAGDFIKFFIGDRMYNRAISENKGVVISVESNETIPLESFNATIYTMEMIASGQSFGQQIKSDYSISDIMEELNFNYNIELK